MDKATAERLVTELIYAYQRFYTTPTHESNTAVENYADAKLKIIEALTTPEPTGPTQTYYLPMYETGPATCRYCHQDYTLHGLGGRCQIKGCDLSGPPARETVTKPPVIIADPPEATPSKPAETLHDVNFTQWWETEGDHMAQMEFEKGNATDEEHRQIARHAWIASRAREATQCP